MGVDECRVVGEFDGEVVGGHSEGREEAGGRAGARGHD